MGNRKISKSSKNKKMGMNKLLLKKVGKPRPKSKSKASKIQRRKKMQNRKKSRSRKNKKMGLRKMMETIVESINQSNFYSANIPGETRLSAAIAKSVFNSKIKETVP